jgi:DNA-binding transcriptional LysR family regulator
LEFLLSCRSTVRQLRRLNQLWNWLPAFRAVGETQHLPTASESLHVSPSALSRSIKLLEEDLNTELFKRSARGLELTDEGKRLLQAVRQAMQALEDGASAIAHGTYPRQVSVATSTPFARELVLPAIRMLSRMPLNVRIHSLDGGAVTAGLLSGEVDMALLSEPPTEPELAAEPLMKVEQAIYCGPKHPLHGKQRITLDELLTYAFVAPPPPIHDGWPPAYPRTVTLTVSQLALAVDAVADGDVLGALPELSARRAVREGKLRRLPVELPQSFTVYCVRRVPVGMHPPALELLTEAIRRRARDLSDETHEERMRSGDTLRIAPIR